MKEASAKHVDECVATVCDQLRTTLQEAQAQLTAETQQQKQYYDQRIGAMDLKPGNLVLVKADAFNGKRKITYRWEDEACEVVHQIATDAPSCKVMDQCRQSFILHQNWLLLHYMRGWHSLVCRCLPCMGQMYQPHPMQANFQGKCRLDGATRE